jgi:pimeloyl-ACP methyl ester carboxylesterase
MTLRDDFRTTQKLPASHGWRWFLLVVVLILATGGVYIWRQQVLDRRPLSPEHAALKSAAQSAATDLKFKVLRDGGVLINGRLAGRQFTTRIPHSWNHQAAVFAHGYTLPGASITIPFDPLKEDSFGLLATLYAHGFAIGESAFDKSGIAVESGVYNTLRLTDFLDRLGANRVYLTGRSMGGNITMALIEQHPHTFAGALSACGEVDGWPSEIGHFIDLRATYNYFTEGTKYALPGDHDLVRSALSSEPPPYLRALTPIYQLVQIKRLSAPILALFAAAQAHPEGLESHLIDNISSASGTPAEVASFLYPLVTIGLGMDDLNQTFAGIIYGNDMRVYHANSLSDDENASFNQTIQRIQANPYAVGRAALWHQSTGAFDIPLVTLHNQVDSVVPYSQEESLRASVERSANQANLLQRTVPPLSLKIPSTDVMGIAHCGFTTPQVASAWQDLQTWVETGQKPQ